ncbi:dehydrogenase/reductase [Powellomyces hirtus]|nr:dehydrogenase/reductase [Powellomyces hirtus]
MTSATTRYDSAIVVTGGTTGLGYECAKQLATAHPTVLVLVASRSNPNPPFPPNVEHIPLDLASQKDIRRCAAEIIKTLPRLQALVLNAGLQVASGLTFTKEGVETTFGVNHLGHALLLALLKDHLLDDARIVWTASGTHDPAQKTGVPDAVYTTAEELAHPNVATAGTSGMAGRQRYSTSKLCNVLYAYALHRHIRQSNKGKKWTVTVMDPGLMPGTALTRDAHPILRVLFEKVLPYAVPVLQYAIPNTHTPAESGAALARLAAGEDVKDVSGVYYEGVKEIPSSVDSRDEAKQDDLWNWTLNAMAENEEEKKRFAAF